MRPSLHLRTAVGLSPAESTSFIEAGTAGRFHPHDLLLIADGAELSNAQDIAMDAGRRGVTVWRPRSPATGWRCWPTRRSATPSCAGSRRTCRDHARAPTAMAAE